MKMKSTKPKNSSAGAGVATDQTTVNIKNVLLKNGASVVALVSFFINMVVLFDYHKSPFSNFLLWDSSNYWKWAQEIASGDWLGNTIFHQAPLYPYLLSVFISVFGEILLPIYIFQCCISAATAAAVYSVCTKITRNNFAGLLAGLLFSLYGMQVFYSTRILSECIAAFLIILTVRLLISGKFYNRTLLSGFLMGLLLLVKPHFILAVPFILFFYAIGFKQRPPSELLKKMLFFILPLMLTVSVVTIRNYYVGKEFVLISSNGGEVFYMGNNDKAEGTYMAVDGISRDITFQNEDIISVAHSNSGKKLTRSGVSRYWYKKGISFIWNEPLRYVILEWKKFRNIFSGAERTNMYSMVFEKYNLTSLLKIPFVNFYLLFPFLCVGLVTALRQWKKYYLLLLFLIVNCLNIMIFFYDTRFFVLTMPLFIVISSTGLWNILNLYRAHKLSPALFRRSSSMALLSGLALLILILYRDSKFPSQDWRFFMVLGEIYYDMGSYDKSIENYIKSFERNKSDFRSSIGACKALLKQGNITMAADLYMLTLKALGEKNKHMIVDDPDFDRLRDYIVSKSNQAAVQ